MLALGGQISCSSSTSFQFAGKFGFCLDSFLALVPSWYRDCNQVVEVGGCEGQKASVQGETGGLWRKCAGEGATRGRF